jgi:hypothetical protein
MRDPKERLRDILADAIVRIERYASRGREAFEVRVLYNQPTEAMQLNRASQKNLKELGYGG